MDCQSSGARFSAIHRLAEALNVDPGRMTVGPEYAMGFGIAWMTRGHWKPDHLW
jgi:hypothetical protein